MGAHWNLDAAGEAAAVGDMAGSGSAFRVTGEPERAAVSPTAPPPHPFLAARLFALLAVVATVGGVLYGFVYGWTGGIGLLICAGCLGVMAWDLGRREQAIRVVQLDAWRIGRENDRSRARLDGWVDW